MAIGASLTLRNAMLDQLPAMMGSGAKLRIYSGTRPATGGTVTTLLAEFTLGSTPFTGSAANAQLTFAAITSVNAQADGTATWARIVRSDNTFVLDLSAGTTGTDVILNSAQLSQNALVAVLSPSVINFGNP